MNDKPLIVLVMPLHVQFWFYNLPHVGIPFLCWDEWASHTKARRSKQTKHVQAPLAQGPACFTRCPPPRPPPPPPPGDKSEDPPGRGHQPAAPLGGQPAGGQRQPDAWPPGRVGEARVPLAAEAAALPPGRSEPQEAYHGLAARGPGPPRPAGPACPGAAVRHERRPVQGARPEGHHAGERPRGRQLGLAPWHGFRLPGLTGNPAGVRGLSDGVHG